MTAGSFAPRPLLGRAALLLADPARTLAAAGVLLPLVVAALLAVHPLGPLVLVGAAAVAWLFFWPTRRLLVLVLLYVPFHVYLFGREMLTGHKAALGPFTVVGVGKDLLLLFVLASWLFATLSGRGERARGRAAGAWLLAFLGWALIHVADVSSLALGAWGFRNYAEYAALFFVAAGAAGGAARVRASLLVLVFSAVPVMIYGAFELFTNRLLQALAAGVLSMEDRLAGVFGGFHATNAYAVYLVIVILAALGSLRSARSGALRLFLVAAAAFAAASLLFTFSRRAWLATIAGGLVLAALSRRRAPILLALAGAAVAAFALAPSVVAERFQTVFETASAANRGRVVEWRLVLGRVFADPASALWGIGLGRVGPVAQEFGVPGAVSTHNAYVCLLGELGLPGLALFLAAMAAVLARGLRVVRNARDETTAAAAGALLAILVALLVTGLAGVTLQTFPSSMYFWLLAGLLTHLTEEES